MITISAPAEYDYYQSQAYIAAELIDWVRFRYPEIIADEILRDGQIIFFWSEPSYCGTLYPSGIAGHQVTDRATSQSVAGEGTYLLYQA